MAREFEYVIVGSGVAGSTVASHLLRAKRSTSILILEAGPRVQERNRRFWWDYVVEANGREYKPYDFTTDKHGETTLTGDTPLYVPGSRLMIYGGSTVHWGGWSLRFKPEDFKLRSHSGEGGDWPLDYAELAPYYQQAEEYLSVCGDVGESWNQKMRPDTPYPRPPFGWTAADGEMIEAFEKHEIEPGKMPLARYRKCMTTGTCKYCPIGARFSGQYVLDELLRDTRNTELRVIGNSPVTKILMDRKRHAVGVEYMDLHTGEYHEVHAGTTIICSGTYEAPKLLLRSKNRFWQSGIGNDTDRVGRYLVSHSLLKVTGERNGNDECWFQEYDFPTLMSRTYDTEEYSKRGKNKIFLFKNRKLPNIDFAAHMIRGRSRKQIDEIWRESRQQELQAFMEEKGQFENRIALAPGTNRFGLPNMKIHFDRTLDAKKNGNEWLGRMGAVIETMGYRVLHDHKKLHPRIESPGGHHACSTCRMGDSPKYSVTNADMRIHGVDNLYVCSNAAFPSGAAVNPTLTLVAMAYRLGDHLLGRGRRAPDRRRARKVKQ